MAPSIINENANNRLFFYMLDKAIQFCRPKVPFTLKSDCALSLHDYKTNIVLISKMHLFIAK
jgi:hypothetical protein